MEFSKALFGLARAFNCAMVLFDDVVQVLDRSMATSAPSMSNLGNTYAEEGKYTQAEPLLTKALETQLRVRGPLHRDTLYTRSHLVSTYQREGKYAFAENHATEVLAKRRQAFGSQHAETMASAADLALVYVSEGKFDASEPLAREA